MLAVAMAAGCGRVTVTGSVGGTQPALRDAFYVVPEIDARETEGMLVRLTDMEASCDAFTRAHREARTLALSGGTPADYAALHARLFPPVLWVVDLRLELSDVDDAYTASALTHADRAAVLPVDTFVAEARRWTTAPDRQAYDTGGTWAYGDRYLSVAGSGVLSKQARGADASLTVDVQFSADATASSGATLRLDIAAPLCPLYEAALNGA